MKPPIACDMTALDAGERTRHAALTREVLAAATIAERPEDFVLELPGDAASFAGLVELAGYERCCCPFFRFALSFAGAGESVTLTIGGSPEAKAFLVASGWRATGRDGRESR